MEVEKVSICDFCGKGHWQVKRMIRNKKELEKQQIHICDECVYLCVEIIEQESGE